MVFQSPRSGQICSNLIDTASTSRRRLSFNPLDRVKFVQIYSAQMRRYQETSIRFNPLDRVKFVQIVIAAIRRAAEGKCFNPLDRVKFVQI